MDARDHPRAGGRPGPGPVPEPARAVGAITAKGLTKRLRELERAGLASREIYAEVPPRVEYRLSPLGATLPPALAGLHHWATAHAGQVAANRARYDDAAGGLADDPPR